MSSEPKRSIAIIGGGFSGTLIATHLLRRAAAGTRITLIERRLAVGRGVAYGTECDRHLLNVPAGRMSALADEPEHFLAWVRARVGQPGYPERTEPGDFVPRMIYGDYVAALLTAARQQAAPGVEFELLTGTAIDLEPRATGGGRITLADTRAVEASRVVLALGNLPGEYPIRRSLPFYHGPRYAHLPWQPGALEGIGPTDDVLLVGAGLTAIDLIVQFAQRGHRGTIHALSRRGLLPLAHRPGLAPYPPFLAAEAPPTTVLALLRRVRAELRCSAQQNVDWRAVVDAIRPQAPALWQALPEIERARFMRHVRPHWEVHRHRIAPQVAATIDEMRGAGRVKFHAGRLQSLREIDGAAAAIFRRRGTEEMVALRVVKVINCTGPRTDYSKYQHPLLINLLARGLIDHDPLALGLNALPDGSVCAYRAGPVGWLYTIGAPLKGVLWECTAVPEIRVQARALAERLLKE